MSEEEKKAIEEIKKDDEYLNILQDIKKNKYNMYNVAKLMQDTTTGDYTEYEIAECIVYFIKLLEKRKKEIKNLMGIINKEHELNLDKRYVELKFISKEKIREKIKDLEKHRIMSSDDFTIKVLKDLLEEN